MKKLLAITLLAVLALAALLLTQSSSNRGWTYDLKPGSIITADEIKRLEEKGWRLVKLESLYLYHGASRLHGRCNATLLLAETLRPSSWARQAPRISSP